MEPGLSEERVDPADGIVRTYAALLILRRTKGEGDADIKKYWDTACKVVAEHYAPGTLCFTKDTTIAYNGPTLERLGSLAVGRLLVIDALPQRVQGRLMVPIQPNGMVELSRLQVVPLGARVRVGDEAIFASVRFAGTVNFAKGIWVGVECDEPLGKNDGSFDGCSYFSCPAGHGLFVRPKRLRLLKARGVKQGKQVPRAADDLPSPAGRSSPDANEVQPAAAPMQPPAPPATAPPAELSSSQAPPSSEVGNVREPQEFWRLMDASLALSGPKESWQLLDASLAMSEAKASLAILQEEVDRAKKVAARVEGELARATEGREVRELRSLLDKERAERATIEQRVNAQRRRNSARPKNAVKAGGSLRRVSARSSAGGPAVNLSPISPAPSLGSAESSPRFSLTVPGYEETQPAISYKSSPPTSARIDMEGSTAEEIGSRVMDSEPEQEGRVRGWTNFNKEEVRARGFTDVDEYLDRI